MKDGNIACGLFVILTAVAFVQNHYFPAACALGFALLCGMLLATENPDDE